MTYPQNGQGRTFFKMGFRIWARGFGGQSFSTNLVNRGNFPSSWLSTFWGRMRNNHFSTIMQTSNYSGNSIYISNKIYRIYTNHCKKDIFNLLSARQWEKFCALETVTTSSAFMRSHNYLYNLIWPIKCEKTTHPWQLLKGANITREGPNALKISINQRTANCQKLTDFIA